MFIGTRSEEKCKANIKRDKFDFRVVGVYRRCMGMTFSFFSIDKQNENSAGVVVHNL